MASNYTLKSGSYEGRYLQLYCTQTKDIATNKSKISWTLSSLGGSVNYYSTGPTSVTINGTKVYEVARKSWDSKVFPAAKGSVSGTIDVSHDAKGDKSISVSFTTAIYVGTASTYSGTWTLDNIPRQATITKFPANFTSNGEPPTIEYSNPAGNNVTSLEICIADNKAYYGYAPYRTLKKDKTSYQFTADDMELLKAKAGKTLDVTFCIRTTINNTVLGTHEKSVFTMVEDETTKPSVSMGITLNNGSLPSQFNGLYIQGKSKVKVSLSATPKYSATIKSYSATLKDASGETVKTYNSNDFTTDAIQAVGNISLIGSAKDSREFTGSTSKSFTVIPYSKPLVIPIGSENAILCYRSDENGKRVSNKESVWVKAKRYYQTVTSGGVQKNFCALEWRRKLATASWDSGNEEHKWRDLIPKTNTTTTEYNALLTGDYAEFDATKSYTVQIRAIDDIGEEDVKTFEIPTEDVALHLGKGGKNVSIGTYCDYSKEHTFYSEWDAYFDKDIYVGDIKIVDFPIEQGTSGIWTYEKRNSGVAECWGKWTGKLTNYTSTNNFYVYVKKFNFPEGLFVSPPIPTYGAAVDNAICCSGLVLNLSKDSMNCYVMAIIGGENDVTFYIQAKGRWKD